MRLIDAEYVENVVRETHKRSYTKFLQLLKKVPTVNPTCPECGTVLEGEIHERHPTDSKAD